MKMNCFICILTSTFCISFVMADSCGLISMDGYFGCRNNIFGHVCNEKEDKCVLIIDGYTELSKITFSNGQVCREAEDDRKLLDPDKKLYMFGVEYKTPKITLYVTNLTNAEGFAYNIAVSLTINKSCFYKRIVAYDSETWKYTEAWKRQTSSDNIYIILICIIVITFLTLCIGMCSGKLKAWIKNIYEHRSSKKNKKDRKRTENSHFTVKTSTISALNTYTQTQIPHSSDSTHHAAYSTEFIKAVYFGTASSDSLNAHYGTYGQNDPRTVFCNAQNADTSTRSAHYKTYNPNAHLDKEYIDGPQSTDAVTDVLNCFQSRQVITTTDQSPAQILTCPVDAPYMYRTDELKSAQNRRNWSDNQSAHIATQNPNAPLDISSSHYSNTATEIPNCFQGRQVITVTTTDQSPAQILAGPVDTPFCTDKLNSAQNPRNWSDNQNAHIVTYTSNAHLDVEQINSHHNTDTATDVPNCVQNKQVIITTERSRSLSSISSLDAPYCTDDLHVRSEPNPWHWSDTAQTAHFETYIPHAPLDINNPHNAQNTDTTHDVPNHVENGQVIITADSSQAQISQLCRQDPNCNQHQSDQRKDPNFVEHKHLGNDDLNCPPCDDIIKLQIKRESDGGNELINSFIDTNNFDKIFKYIKTEPTDEDAESSNSNDKFFFKENYEIKQESPVLNLLNSGSESSESFGYHSMRGSSDSNSSGSGEDIPEN